MKASWSGYLRIGEMTAPIRLYSGTQTVAPRYVQLHAKDHSPVTRVTKCKKDGEELAARDIVRAVEHDGKYIEIKETDIQAGGDHDRILTVRQFSDNSSIILIIMKNHII